MKKRIKIYKKKHQVTHKGNPISRNPTGNEGRERNISSPERK
jgi:hypothetical protein